jgi:hypothetical protein
LSFWKTPSFKALQRAWYARLEKEGFRDAEEQIGGEFVLKQIAAHPYRGMDHLAIQTKEAYYRLLGLQIQNGEFANEVDRLIVTMFAEGHKIKRIHEALVKQGTQRSRGTIRFTIRKYEMKWGLREYTPKQLNKKEAS